MIKKNKACKIDGSERRCRIAELEDLCFISSMHIEIDFGGFSLISDMVFITQMRLVVAGHPLLFVFLDCARVLGIECGKSNLHYGNLGEFVDLNAAEIRELIKFQKFGKKMHAMVHRIPQLELEARVQPITSLE